MLKPYRDVWEAQERNELKKTECNPDRTLTAVGLLCQIECEADTKEMLNFWAKRLDYTEILEAEGHVYAFVLPNDNREIGVIEYFQQILPGDPPVDTKQLLGEFARNVILLE